MSSAAHDVSSAPSTASDSAHVAGYFHCDETVGTFIGRVLDAPIVAGKAAGLVGGPVVEADGLLVAAGNQARGTEIAAKFRDDPTETSLAATAAVYDQANDRLWLAGPLYYAEHGDGLVFADSPKLLFAAQEKPPAANDEAVVRFLATGACDEGDVTFFAGVRRVPAGYVLRCDDDSIALAPRRSNVQATMPEPVSVRFGQGITGADLVARYPDAEVFSSSYGPLDPTEEKYVAGAMAALRSDGVSHVVPVDADAFGADLHDFVRTLGEPVPDPVAYVQFATARAAAAAGARTLVDPVQEMNVSPRKPINPERVLRSGLSFTATPSMDRLSVWRRVAAALRQRFDVELATPYLDDPYREPLVPAVARKAVGGLRPGAPLRDWLLRLKNRLYELFHTESFVARPWFDEMAIREAFEGFIKGRNTDAELFWRIIMVELWAQEFLDPPKEEQPERQVKAPLAANVNKQIEITVGDEQWARIPIRTELFAKGDPFPEKIAGFVAPIVALADQDSAYREQLLAPWYLLVSEKIVAISQGRSYFVWEIEPSWWARTLSRFVVKTPYGIGLGSPWTMQLAISEAGLPRILFASVAGAAGKLVGKRGLFYQLAGHSVRAIDGPTEYSVYPANVSAKLPPAEPAKAAAQIRTAVEQALRDKGLDRQAAALAGCVVIDANDIGRNVLGLDADRPEGFYEELFADNPLGQGSEQTPLAVAIQLTK